MTGAGCAVHLLNCVQSAVLSLVALCTVQGSGPVAGVTVGLPSAKTPTAAPTAAPVAANAGISIGLVRVQHFTPDVQVNVAWFTELLPCMFCFLGMRPCTAALLPCTAALWAPNLPVVPSFHRISEFAPCSR